MAETCKDCVHYGVCELLEKGIISSKYCDFFKDKANFTEVLCGNKVIIKRHRGFNKITCPICNGTFKSNEPYCEDVEYCPFCKKKLDDTFQNYCPNCGAKMVGEMRLHDGTL